MTSSKSAAAAEWRSYFVVPIAAALGYSTSVIHIYGIGPYLEPLQTEFGWSRSQTAVGLTIATIPIGEGHTARRICNNACQLGNHDRSHNACIGLLFSSI